MSARRAGFTLFEVLGVVLVTTILLTATISFYLNLTRQAARASGNTREVRRAAALLDRIAADLEHTLLVKKPAEEDAQGRPWLFVAEGRFAQRASDQIKFIRREIPRSSAGPASDLAMVAYTLRRSEEGRGFELHRWSTPELPESLEREFPRDDDPASLLVTDGLSYFALRFLDENGEWQGKWDSTLLVDSSELPLVVEIAVGLEPENEDEAETSLDEEPMPYRRQVALPLRPLDLEELLDPEDAESGGEDGDDEEEADDENKTVAACVNVDGSQLSSLAPALGLSASDISNIATKPFAQYKSFFAGHPEWVKPECL